MPKLQKNYRDTKSVSGLISALPKAINMQKGWQLTIIAIPFLVLIMAFYYVPLFGWVYSFFDYKPGIPLAKTPFVGLKFYKLIIQDRDVLRVLLNTLVFAALNLLCSPVPMIFAILLNEIKSARFKKVIQTTTTLPNFISWIVVFSMSFALFSYDGVLNKLLEILHLSDSPVNVLGEINMVYMFQTMLSLWKSTGWSAIIYLAGISGIDQQLYDAAAVDGAGRMRRIWHVTVPGILPTFLVLFLLSIGNIVSVGFDQYFAFYNPLVADRIEVLDLFVYRVGIANNDYAYGTAVGICKTLVSLFLLFNANLLSKKIRGSSMF